MNNNIPVNIPHDCGKFFFNRYLTTEDVKSYALGQDQRGYADLQVILRECLAEYLKKIAIELGNPEKHGNRCTAQSQALREIEVAILANDGNRFLAKPKWEILAHKDLQKISLLIANTLKTVHPLALNQLETPPPFMPNLVDMAMALQGIKRVCQRKGEYNKARLVHYADQGIFILTREKAWLPLFHMRTSNESYVQHLCKNNEWKLAVTFIKKFNFPQEMVNWLRYRKSFDALIKNVEKWMEDDKFQLAKSAVDGFIQTRHPSEGLTFPSTPDFRYSLFYAYLERKIRKLIENGQLDLAWTYYQLADGNGIKKQDLHVLNLMIGEAKIDKMLLQDQLVEAKEHFISKLTSVGKSYSEDPRISLVFDRLSLKIIEKIVEKESFEPALTWAEDIIELIETPFIITKALEIIEIFPFDQTLSKAQVEAKMSKIEEIFQVQEGSKHLISAEVVKKFRRDNSEWAAFSFIKKILEWKEWLKVDWLGLCMIASQPLIDQGNYDQVDEVMKDLLSAEDLLESEVLRSITLYVNYIRTTAGLKIKKAEVNAPAENTSTENTPTEITT